MGLISWIKCKYYNHKLDSADSHLAKGNVDKAEEIYISLLDKQDEAVVHLSNLYVIYSSSKELKLDRLQKIENLNEFVNENNSSDYQKELKNHVSNIYNMAQQLFVSQDYDGAVSLYESIKKYRGNESEFQDRYHRYKAFLSFAKSQRTSTYKTNINECVEELKLIKSSKESDIRSIQQILSAQKRFARAICLLLPFKALNGDFKNSIIDYIIQILSNNDSEQKNPKCISEFCSDIEINSLASREVAARAVALAAKSRYAESVIFDNFASEFLSDDNKFNIARCQHILEELSSRANHQEVSKLLQLVHKLNLSDSQISVLKKRIHEIAITTEKSKGIKICRLFKGEKLFDESYFQIATKFAEENEFSCLDSNELRSVISNISTDENVTDYLAPFVESFVNFKDEFYSITNKLYDNGEADAAYALCSKLEKYKNAWISLYIQLRDKDFVSVSGISQSIRFYKDTTDKISLVCSSPNSLSDSAYSKLWSDYSQLVIKKSTSQPKDKAIENLTEFREKVLSNCKSTHNFKNIVDLLSNQLVKILWSYAVELEEEFQYDKSIELYERIKHEDIKSYTIRASFRYLIANVKSEKIDAELDKQINEMLNTHSFESLRDDLAYRYALLLLKTTHPSEAETILKKYLPDEKGLLSVCNNIFIKEAEDKLQELNSKFAAMNNGELSADEAIDLYTNFESTIAIIASRLTDTRTELPSYKIKLESYILRRLFNEEQYSEAFDKMKLLHPDFITDDNAFRNIAIASLGLLENGETDDNKIKMAISVWLSAIYTDKLFVKSLDFTSWDDQYTFTLQNSFGDSGEYDYSELPDNVNFDDPIENQVIAIKDVQNSLLSRIEVIIRDKYPNYEDFYNSEKSAIDGIIKLSLDEDFIIASPYLAKSLNNVFISISHALEYDYDQNYDNNEDVLNLGVTYGLTGEAFIDYKATSQMADNCCSSLSGSLQTQRSAFANISRIKDFEKLYSRVKTSVSTAMNEAIKNKVHYKTFIDQYEVICKALNETVLSMTCANYVNSEVIHLLNNNTMKERDGVVYLVRIYKLAPSNFQIKQNLEAVLCSLARDCEENNITADVNVLNQALRDTGTTFKAKVEDARVTGKLNIIIDKVNNKKMANDAALKAVHDLYIKYPNNDRICENLVTICSICISQYVIGDSYSSTVTSILTRIDNNKSATFKKHAKKLAKEYLDIWKQLPYETQMLLSGMGALTGKTLNSHGLDLQKGLEFLKRLGDAPDMSIGSILGRGRGHGLGLFDNDFPF